VGYDCGNSRRFDELLDGGKRNESPEFWRESGAKMVKRKTRKPQQGKNPGPGKPQNAQLNVQTRRVLTQHYRAKYGVK
jgi:hypothetical protein